jgi:His/Glu/Gln/Arg/opine family amino acid ABC transporter permease subunit
MNLWEIIGVLLVGYPKGPEMIDPNYPAFIQQIGGLSLTLIITMLSLILGTPLGIVFGLCRQGARGGGTKPVLPERISRWMLCAAVNLVVEVIRGIPIMITVLLAYYLPYRLFGFRIPPIILAVTAFSLYSSVYLSDIFRSGFRAVDSGWVDAARVLGLNRRQILFKIKLPTAVRAMTPALVGLAITIFKDTSVLVVVAVGELTWSARQIQVAQPGGYALVLGLVIGLYWGIATAGSVVCSRLEKVFSAELSV